MEVRVITAGRAEVVAPEDLATVLQAPDALVWVDMPTCDEAAVDVLRDVFRFHPAAIWECRQRQRMPKGHAYSDHLFVALHAPHVGEHGHVHYVELDQFVGLRYLVTVHGPTNPAVPAHVPLRDTTVVWDRIVEGRFHPTSPMDISHAVVASLMEGMEEVLELVTTDVWRLEQRVTLDRMRDPETFLDEMFRTRHGLLAVSNMCSSSWEVYDRLLTVARGLPEPYRQLVSDTVDHFRRVRRLADNQRDYLQGVIEFYRTRTDTKMTIAAERLAVIAVVTLPITALASILGMNVIVNQGTHTGQLAAALVVMLAMSTVLLRWARRQGWW